MRRLWADRTFRALVAAGALIALAGSLRPKEVSGMYPEKFWLMKVGWQGCADVVVTGDSRVGLGVSPAVMRRRLGNWRIMNFGFNANGYSTCYLAAAEKVLDPHSKRPTVVLGITPRSLTPRAQEMNFFKVYRHKGRSERILVGYFGDLLGFVAPMRLHEVIYGLFPGLKDSYFYRYYSPFGWLASHKTKPRPNQKLDNYRHEFAQSRVSPRIVGDLLRFVRRWHARGITVYGFRVPSTERMVALEEEYSGFHEKQFVQAFEAAGGVWLELNQCGYASFDGSHLDRRAAERLSADLAERMLQAGFGQQEQ